MVKRYYWNPSNVLVQDANGELVKYEDYERLRRALEGTLSWLSSYPGGGAENAYNETRKALEV